MVYGFLRDNALKPMRHRRREEIGTITFNPLRFIMIC